MKKRGDIIIITGCSGAGKTEVAKNLLEIKKLKLQRVITCTSRVARDNEKEGKDYFFLKEQEFIKNIKENKMFEWAKVYGKYYGSKKKDVEKIIKSGKNVLFVVDIQGALKIKRENECQTIFISVENLKELRNRLSKRATDSREVIESRIKEAKKEILSSKLFDKIIINRNEKLEETIKEAARIISKIESKK